MSEWYVRKRYAQIHYLELMGPDENFNLRSRWGSKDSRTVFTDRKLAHAWALASSGIVVRKRANMRLLEEHQKGRMEERGKIVKWLMSHHLITHSKGDAVWRGDHWK